MPFYFSRNILAENSMQTSVTNYQSTHPSISNSCITDNCECFCQNYICNCVCSTQYPEKTTVDTFNQGTTITTVSNNIDTTGRVITTHNPITHETISTITDPETQPDVSTTSTITTITTTTTLNYNNTYTNGDGNGNDRGLFTTTLPTHIDTTIMPLTTASPIRTTNHFLTTAGHITTSALPTTALPTTVLPTTALPTTARPSSASSDFYPTTNGFFPASTHNTINRNTSVPDTSSSEKENVYPNTTVLPATSYSVSTTNFNANGTTVLSLTTNTSTSTSTSTTHTNSNLEDLYLYLLQLINYLANILGYPQIDIS